jgi:excisionase family DNA binding protein
MSDYLTPKDIAQKYGVHRYSVLRWIKQGKLKAVRLDRQFKISREDLETFIKLK